MIAEIVALVLLISIMLSFFYKEVIMLNSEKAKKIFSTAQFGTVLDMREDSIDLHFRTVGAMINDAAKLQKEGFDVSANGKILTVYEGRILC